MSRDRRKPYKPRCPKGARLIPLTLCQWTIVDADKYEWLMGWKWCALWNTNTQSYYVVRNETVDECKGRSRKLIRMHQQIMGVTDPKIQVDHIRQETLDNRVLQLDVGTDRQNKRNLKKSGSSKYSNVSWDKTNNKRVVYFRAGDSSRININMGRFTNEDEAGAVAKIVQDYVDANPKCTAQDLKDLRARIKG